MVRVSTFCPRCGESIETEVPNEAKASGRAELACPACRFEFVIAPARRDPAEQGGPPVAVPPETGARSPPEGPVRATEAARTQQAARGGGISFKPLAAGLMLFFTAVIGLWMGSVLLFTDDLVEGGFSAMEGTGNFTGLVEDPNGEPLSGVQVTVIEGPEGPLDAPDQQNATTDAEGRYRFRDLPAGIHVFRLEKENHTTVQLEAPVYSEEFSPLFGGGSAFGSVTMPAGDPSQTEQVSRVEEIQSAGRIWGGFTVVASILAIAGGWAALRRKGFPLALTGAIAGVFTFGFVIGSLVAFIALVLILFSRKEFEPLRGPRRSA